MASPIRYDAVRSPLMRRPRDMIARPLAVAAAAAALALPVPASAIDIPSTAIVVTPLGEGRVALGDDGKDHVEYDLLVTNVFDKPVTLSRLEVLDPAGKVLMTMEGEALKAATQTLMLGEPLAAVPASGAAALEVDLIVAPGTAPAEVTHRLGYAVPDDSAVAAIVGTTTVDGPAVTIDRTPATVIISPLAGAGWAAINGCCAPNIHRNVRVGAGTHIARPELFAIDWMQLDGDRLFSGDGKANTDYAYFGHPLRAVADGTVVGVRDGMEESTPFAPVTTVKKPDDYGGNHIVLEIAPDVYAFYAHLQPGSLKVKVGDNVTAGSGHRDARQHRQLDRAPPPLRPRRQPGLPQRRGAPLRHRPLHRDRNDHRRRHVRGRDHPAEPHRRERLPPRRRRRHLRVASQCPCGASSSACSERDGFGRRRVLGRWTRSTPVTMRAVLAAFFSTGRTPSIPCLKIEKTFSTVLEWTIRWPAFVSNLLLRRMADGVMARELSAGLDVEAETRRCEVRSRGWHCGPELCARSRPWRFRDGTCPLRRRATICCPQGPFRRPWTAGRPRNRWSACRGYRRGNSAWRLMPAESHPPAADGDGFDGFSPLPI